MSVVRTRDGDFQYASVGARTVRRKIGTKKWLRVVPAELKLVLQIEPSRGGFERDHWLLFLTRDSRPTRVYQVKGVANNMRYQHLTGVDILKSPRHKRSYTIARPTEAQLARVEHWATHVWSPCQVSTASARGDSQRWTIKVIAHLVEEGIVESRFKTLADSLYEPHREDSYSVFTP